ncbi:MAG: hypothetical protein ACREDA_12545, partial [Methylocella sp.]
KFWPGVAIDRVDAAPSPPFKDSATISGSSCHGRQGRTMTVVCLRGFHVGGTGAPAAGGLKRLVGSP